ncbi:hypothetical protein A2U01_0059492, partial [Trifolium medium]|nr:hypothetical protein [Trifolium medium]
MSTLYLSMKYPLDNDKVGVVKGDQALARRCYESSLKIKHKTSNASHNTPSQHAARDGGVNVIDTADLDPREEFQDRRVSLIEELEQVQIGEESHQTTNLGTALQPAAKVRILKILKDN